MMLRASEASKSLIQAKSKAKVVAEISTSAQTITNIDVEQIKGIKEVTKCNRLSTNYAYLTMGQVLTNREGEDVENQTITLLACDDLTQDSAFFEERYRLLKGSYLTFEAKQKAVISASLATANNLQLGDEIGFEASNGKQASATIVGLFQSNSESKQDDNIASRYRIENQVYLDHTTYANLYENDGFYKVAIYTSQPEQLAQLTLQVMEILGDKVELVASDTLFKQMVAPLNQIIKVSKLVFMLSFFTGFLIVSLLLCMWMRGRQKEMAILISMGKSKQTLLLQVLLESFLVFLASIIGACGLGSVFANRLQILFTSAQTSELSLQVTLQWSDTLSLFGIGCILIGIAVGISFLSVLFRNPQDTLSKMEG